MKELCLAGACNRGFCYLGALQNLYNNKLLEDLETIVGVSIGSFVGYCYIIGYEPVELFDLLLWEDLNKLKDIEFNLDNHSVLRGEIYKDWIKGIIEKKLEGGSELTFMECFDRFGKNMIISGTCINDRENPLVYFSKDSTPDMPVYKAIIASSAIPFIFPYFEYNEKKYIDGGVLDNFPMKLLGPKALGLRVRCTKDHNISNIFSYANTIFEIVTRQLRVLDCGEGTIVEINTDDFDILDFGISVDDKLTLYKRGEKSIDNYILNQSL